MRRLGGVMWHTKTYFHSLINVCDRFLKRTKLSLSGARPGRELFITCLGLGAHGGANDLVPLLPTSLCKPNEAICIALGERHACREMCNERNSVGRFLDCVRSQSGGDDKEGCSWQDSWRGRLGNWYQVHSGVAQA